MAKKFKRSDRSRPYLNVLEFMVQEKTFLTIIIGGIILAGIFTGNTHDAMVLCFIFAAYDTGAIDSIQYLVTFFEINRNNKLLI